MANSIVKQPQWVLRVKTWQEIFILQTFSNNVHTSNND